MGLTLKEALELEILSRFKLVAGEQGLERLINKVGILDHESGQTITDTFVEGEFTLASLLAVKDDADALLPLVERLIDAETACLAVKSVYFEELPRAVIALANAHQYPIFMFDVTYFEDIIMVINGAVKEKEAEAQLAMRLEHMLSNDWSGFQIRNLAYELIPRFEECHLVFYLDTERGSDPGDCGHEDFGALLEAFPNTRTVAFRSGVLGVVSVSQSMENLLQACREVLQGLMLEGHRMGLSAVHLQVEDMKHAIQEALYAVEYGDLKQMDLILYSEMGIERILLPLKNDPHVMAYYNQLIKPLLDYDREHGSELLKTAEAFVNHEADYKATAAALYQHGNTIRYRMEKIRKLIQQHSGGHYGYEELAVAIKLHRIYR